MSEMQCARLFAINIAHYESVHGALPLDKTLEMAYAESPNEEQLSLMTRGMEALICLLGGIVQRLNEKTNH